jgi:hypothetical protein
MIRPIQGVVLLLLLCGLALPSPAFAQDCQELLPHGVYTGTTSVVMTIRGYAEGILAQEFTYNDTGDLALTVGCTVTAGTYHWNVYRTLMFFPGATPIVCAYSADLSQASGVVVAGANGQPRMDVRWSQGVINPNDCVDAGPAETAATWQFSLAGPPQDRTITGDFRIRYDNPDGQDYEDLAQMFREQGFEVTLTKSWTLTRAPQPSVQSLGAALRQYFLAGIPVTNRYTAAVDWDDAGPGVARFLVGNDPPRAMTVAGATATIDLPLASIPGAGAFPFSVEAELEGRIDRLDGLDPLILVPVPAWAALFNLQPQVQANHVRYAGQYALPTQPLDAHITLPNLIPYVGGTWGLLPTQLKLALAANSLGTRETGGLTAQGGFGLGKRIYTLAAHGAIYGTITPSALNFESDQLTLSTPPIVFSEQLGLVSLVPGATAFFDVPVIGSLLRALNAALGITAEVHGGMTGRGRLGVSGSTLALTEGSFDATLGVLATAGLDTPFAWATVAGGGDGTLDMRIVPTAHVNACQVLLSFQARAGAFGFHLVDVQERWQVLSCTTTTGQTVLVTVPTPRQAPRTVYGAPGLPQNETHVTQLQVTNGLTETVLAANASAQARPLLATGADGRMALVWNSISSRGAADAVSLRIFDGAAWGNVIGVSEPDLPAFTPSAAFTADGALLIAWAEAQTAPDPGGITAAFAQSLEIAWVEVNPATGQTVRRGLATDDSVLDFAPRLHRAADGAVWLAWQRSPGTDLAGSAATPNQWRAAAWQGAGWAAAETAGQNGVGVLFWDVAAVDAQRVWLVADVDMDGNLDTPNDREIFVYRRTAAGWGAPLRLTNDGVIDSGPLLAVNSAGLPVLAWRHGDTVRGLVGDPTTAPVQTWFDADAGVSAMLGSGRLLVNVDGALTLLWPDGAAQGQDVWLARRNPATQLWSQPAPIFASAEQRRSLSAALLPGGDILLGLAATPVISETVDFGGGNSAEVPGVGDAARLLVARIPAGYLPVQGAGPVYLPLVTR